MKVNKGWIYDEYFALENEKNELEARTERYRRACFLMAEKENRGVDPGETKSIEIQGDEGTLKVSKVVSHKIDVDVDKLFSELGDAAYEYCDTTLTIDGDDWIDLKEVLPTKVAKRVERIMAREVKPDTKRIDAGFKAGDMKPKTLKKILSDTPTMSLRTNFTPKRKGK